MFPSGVSDPVCLESHRKWCNKRGGKELFSRYSVILYLRKITKRGNTGGSIWPGLDNIQLYTGYSAIYPMPSILVETDGLCDARQIESRRDCSIINPIYPILISGHNLLSPFHTSHAIAGPRCHPPNGNFLLFSPSLSSTYTSAPVSVCVCVAFCYMRDQ